MKEHYCTYSQAVALKRLGFDWDVRGYYYSDFPEHVAEASLSMNLRPKGMVSAPRIDQAAAWLRECKDTIVIAEPYWECEIEDDSDYLTGKWCFVVWKDGCRILCNFDPNKEDEEIWLFDKYEEALSAGIDAALELLGKEVKE